MWKQNIDTCLMYTECGNKINFSARYNGEPSHVLLYMYAIINGTE